MQRCPFTPRTLREDEVRVSIARYYNLTACHAYSTNEPAKCDLLVSLFLYLNVIMTLFIRFSFLVELVDGMDKDHLKGIASSLEGELMTAFADQHIANELYQ